MCLDSAAPLVMQQQRALHVITLMFAICAALANSQITVHILFLLNLTVAPETIFFSPNLSSLLIFTYLDYTA